MNIKRIPEVAFTSLSGYSLARPGLAPYPLGLAGGGIRDLAASPAGGIRDLTSLQALNGVYLYASATPAGMGAPNGVYPFGSCSWKGLRFENYRELGSPALRV
uniref:Uncharacterized protein n=1 Tax=Pyrrhoderma lamaoense TaxID=2282106 RepID=A0A5B9RCH9_9AGAM|nr:hypothetical protein PLAO_000061 [Phellinus lamaoensis]QEG57123.1 hypothetical protein PLAO_000061 [Phellinus lamaoensis]